MDEDDYNNQGAPLSPMRLLHVAKDKTGKIVAKK
jgi:hypothetical protein